MKRFTWLILLLPTLVFAQGLEERVTALEAASGISCGIGYVYGRFLIDSDGNLTTKRITNIGPASASLLVPQIYEYIDITDSPIVFTRMADLFVGVEILIDRITGAVFLGTCF